MQIEISVYIKPEIAIPRAAAYSRLLYLELKETSWTTI